MSSYIIKSFRGGISDFDEKGITGSFKFGSALDKEKKTDSLSCQQAFVDLDTPITEYISHLLPAPDFNMYAFGSSKIYQIADDWQATLVYTHASNMLGLTGVGIGHESDGKSYIYWVAVNTIHRKEIPGLANWSDVDATGGYPKNITDSSNHTMRWINGNLLFCNGRYIGMIAYDSSYTTNALDLGKNLISNSLLDREGYALIGASYANDLSNSELFLWDTVSLSWNKKTTIPIDNIKSLVDTDLKLLLGEYSLAPNTNSQIYSSDFVSTVPITSFPVDATGGLFGSMENTDVDGSLALFGMFDTDTYAQDRSSNGIYTFGRKNKNSPYVLNLDYPLDCDYIYSVRKWTSGIFVSYRQPTGIGYNYKLQVIDYAQTKKAAVYESLELKAPPGYPNKTINWHSVRLSTKPIASGTSISLKYKINKASSWTSARLEGGGTTFNAVGETEAVFFVGAEGKIFEFQITLTPTGSTSPEVYPPIEVFFE